MLYLLLSILALNNIFCYKTIPGNFDIINALEGYLTPEDNMLIFSYNISGKMELYKYEKDSNSSTYSNGYKLELEPFPKNNSDPIKDFYTHIKQAAPAIIQFAIFNEKYLSSYTYNQSENYDFVSLEKIAPNEFCIFYLSKNTKFLNISIKIANFDYQNESFNFTREYIIDEINGTANSYCVKTSNNNIVCGLIEIKPINVRRINITYYLLLLQDEKPIQKNLIYNYDIPGDRENYVNGLFEAHFFKFVPLENEKIIYCLNQLFSTTGNILCGLVIVKDNSKIDILINNTQIFNSFPQSNYLRRNIFSAIKFNNNEVILATIENAVSRENITKLTISNNKNFIKEAKYLNYSTRRSSLLHDYHQILKTKDNDIIFLIIDNNIAKFHEFGYSTCKDLKKNYLYNANEVKLDFNFDPGLFKNHDYDIVFSNEINSICFGKKRERVKIGNIYNKNEIYFKLSLNDVVYIKKNWQYNFTFRNTINEKESETCIYTLNFWPCDEDCDICGNDNEECYDNRWNKVDRHKKETQNFITIVSIFIFLTIFSIIIFILVGFLRGQKLSHNLNRNANMNNRNIQNEILIENERL